MHSLVTVTRRGQSHPARPALSDKVRSKWNLEPAKFSNHFFNVAEKISKNALSEQGSFSQEESNKWGFSPQVQLHQDGPQLVVESESEVVSDSLGPHGL